MTQLEMFDLLTYAAVSQQIEITEATSAVYFDQLGGCDLAELKKAVREWVKTYEDPYRRLPTIGELRAIMRSGKAVIDPKVAREVKIAAIVDKARKDGATRDEIDALLERLDQGLIKV